MIRKTLLSALFALPLAAGLLLAVLAVPGGDLDAAVIVYSEPPGQPGGQWVPRPRQGHRLVDPENQMNYCMCNGLSQNCSPCWEWVPAGDGG